MLSVTPPYLKKDARFRADELNYTEPIKHCIFGELFLHKNKKIVLSQFEILVRRHIKSHRQKLSLIKQYKTISDDLVDTSQQSKQLQLHQQKKKKS